MRKTPDDEMLLAEMIAAAKCETGRCHAVDALRLLGLPFRMSVFVGEGTAYLDRWEFPGFADGEDLGRAFAEAMR